MAVSLLGILCLFTLTAAQNECYEGWYSYGDSCYGLSAEPLTFAEAQEFCDSYRSTLAEVDDANENAFITNLMKAHQVSAGVWLGGTDIFDDGNWVWLSTREKILSYTNWYPSQPGGATGDNCLAIGVAYNYMWIDNPCTNNLYFICEIKAGETVVG